MQHTPAPWTVCRERELGELIEADTVAQIHRHLRVKGPGDCSDPKTWAANAHLIAAAPDLLEALKLSVVTLNAALDEDFPLNLNRDSAVEKALNAIAKAEGRA